MTPAEICKKIHRAVPDAAVEVVPNPGPSGQDSVVVSREHADAVARFLRDDPALAFDYCSNVTGVDWLERKTRVKEVVREKIDGEEKEVEKEVERSEPGCLEVVYHLYSVRLRHGPLILRVRTGDRETDVFAPSLTPVWKSAELQEREIFDLFGVRFEGHPDLRRLLMWDEFGGHPMRKDWVDPDDVEDRVPFKAFDSDHDR